MKSFLVGLQFLTRLHFATQTEWKDEDFGKSVSWFPVIGWIIGLLLCGIFFLLKPFKIPILTGFILVVSELIVTGALLLDGLMDSSDGLFSGRSRERCLEIMKDSHVGAFGVLSALMIILVKTFALASVDTALYPILFAMPTIGRLNLVISICEYPYARSYGIGKSFAAYRSKNSVLYAFAGAALPAFYFGFHYIILLGAAVLFGLYLNSWIVEKIGGTTGDTYGFVTEVTEALLSLLFVILVKGGSWHI